MDIVLGCFDVRVNGSNGSDKNRQVWMFRRLRCGSVQVNTSPPTHFRISSSHIDYENFGRSPRIEDGMNM